MPCAEGLAALLRAVNSAVPGEHLDDDTILDLALDAAEPEVVEYWQPHLAGCALCRGTLARERAAYAAVEADPARQAHLAGLAERVSLLACGGAALVPHVLDPRQPTWFRVRAVERLAEQGGAQLVRQRDALQQVLQAQPDPALAAALRRALAGLAAVPQAARAAITDAVSAAVWFCSLGNGGMVAAASRRDSDAPATEPPPTGEDLVRERLTGGLPVSLDAGGFEVRVVCKEEQGGVLFRVSPPAGFRGRLALAFHTVTPDAASEPIRELLEPNRLFLPTSRLAELAAQGVSGWSIALLGEENTP